VSWRLAAASAAFSCLAACGGGGHDSGPDAASAPAQTTVSTPAQTDDGWQVASLGEVGIAAQPIVDAVNQIRGGTYNEIHSLLIVKDGKLVLEEYGSGRMYDYDFGRPDHLGPVIHFDRDRKHIVHTVSPIFVGT
jgi:hypothetical protein